jgi:hypothetical protein
MGRISLLGTGNIAFSGNEIYSTNNNNLLFGNNLVPTSISTFSIGSSANPFKTLFISASTLQMAAPPGGNSLSILNDGSNFQITNGGLRSQTIYTGGLLISGNNIGADPSVGNLPMTIGTNGLPALQILVPTSSTSTISTTNVIYASGGNSNQWGSSYTIVNQNSAINWNYQGTDVKALTGNWQSTYATVSSLSANWATSSTNYLRLSGGTISGNLTVTGTTSLSTTTISDGLTSQHIQIGNNGNQFSLFRYGSAKFVNVGTGPGAYYAAFIYDTNITTSSKIFTQSIGITDNKKIPAISVVTSTGSLTAYSSLDTDTSGFSYFYFNP